MAPRGDRPFLAELHREAAVLLGMHPARTRVNAYRLDREAFQEVLLARPEIAREISAVLARRQAQLQDVRESQDAEADSPRHHAVIGALLSRIQTFFGLDAPGSGNGASRCNIWACCSATWSNRPR